MSDKMYRRIVVISCVAIWSMLLSAPYQEYDLNYTLAAFALLCSLGVTLGVAMRWFKKPETRRAHRATTLAFLATSSPAAVAAYVFWFCNGPQWSP